MTPTSEDVLAAVRVHADRVHDAVRRLGCSPVAALAVVEQSAFDLVDVVARQPGSAADLVGWWFARARALGQRAADGEPDLPLGGGLLAADEDQAVIAEALEQLAERERVGLLLRDSYALPEQSVAAALGTSADAAMDVVARSRLSLLAALDRESIPSLEVHVQNLPALTRLAEGGNVAARDATTRRHVQSCDGCTSLVASMERAHLLLAGLTVAALPDGEREALLSRVEERARAALPSSASLLPGDGPEDEEEDLPRRLLTPLVAFLLLGLAVLTGLGLGVLLSRGVGSTAVAGSIGAPPSSRPRATAAAVQVSVPPPASLPPLPSPRVFTIAPSPSPVIPSAAPATVGPASPKPAPLTLGLDPTTGPNGATLTVRGTGWPANKAVRLDYLDLLGRQTGSSIVVSAGPDGSFTTTISATDPTGLPGRHTVRGTNGTITTTAAYDAT